MTRTRERDLSPTALAARYSLSPAEAEIALGIVDGRSLAAIAFARGVSVLTIRSQLKAVFRKTATTSQARLAIALLREG